MFGSGKSVLLLSLALLVTVEATISPCESDTWGVSWVSASNGDVPPGAVEAGLSKNGVKLYSGRVSVDDEIISGHVVPGTGLKVIETVPGQVATEGLYTTYEVLVEGRIKVPCRQCSE